MPSTGCDGAVLRSACESHPWDWKRTLRPRPSYYADIRDANARSRDMAGWCIRSADYCEAVVAGGAGPTATALLVAVLLKELRQ